MPNEATAAYVSHSELLTYADTNVNLRKEDVDELRDQVNRLRDDLADYICEHPDYSLVKMLHSGSVAKGTALSTLNDMDVAVYVKKAAVPDERKLISWMMDRLKEALWRLKSDQFKPQTHCVTVSYKNTGLNVDVVPVLYEGLQNDKGFLITKDAGDRVLTSIPLHLEFIRARKKSQPRHYAQVVRFVKWWASQRKFETDQFRMKSFIAELLVAKLSDGGLDLSNYPAALEAFFAYIVKSRLKERVCFTDYYPKSSLPNKATDEFEIFDPVNPENNVAARYTSAQRELIVDKAHDALDAIQYGYYATSKERAVNTWKRVFGPTFKVS